MGFHVSHFDIVIKSLCVYLFLKLGHANKAIAVCPPRDGKCDTLAAIIPVKIFPFLRGISLKLVKNGLKMKKTRQN